MENRWIFLDAGDTFIYGYPTLYEAIRECCLKANVDIPVGQIQDTLHGSMTTGDRASLLYQDQFERYLRELYRTVLQRIHYPGNLELAVDWLWGQWCGGHRFRLFDDARSSLELLRDAGYKLGVVSNWDTTLKSLLQRLGVYSFFDLILVSCEIHLAKPDPAIFHMALEQTGAIAQETWFFGDQVDMDIIPPRQLGMQTIYIDYHGNKKDNGTADFSAPSLSVAAKWVLENKDNRLMFSPVNNNHPAAG